ncbi:branched-chain amino acid transport system ATP-binding protein [Thermomonospora echinospora]|uniref:Branched-chain amino acid transport system ATP-binding protein n=1 Tax=Thermomonospora echinospora TaxID=1992 RepID=A0A1H6B198_9ACTN|nr:hypothetical protein [Thermomonospora echinospora]SEG54653.1 branched-chain amino acid transport system ATP-binding protein [Thermomonospora echinospora]
MTPSRAVTRAGLLGTAAAGPLAGATVLLLADALGGVVKVPGEVVTYMALTGLALACAGLAPALWLARRLPPSGLVAVTGALAALAVALAGLVPAAPVFATAVMVAGALAGPLLTVPRAQAARTPGAPAWWQAAALAGTAAAAWLATAWSAAPGTALVFAGVVAAVLAVTAIVVPDGAHAETAKVRDAARARDVRAALPVYTLVGWAIGAPVMGGLHLLTFRWNLVGEEPVQHLAWALLPAVALVAAGRRAARTVQTAPWLLLAAAAAPMLMATAPGPALLAAGFAVATAAGCLAAAALDSAVLHPLPDDRRPAAAGLTAVAAVFGGLAGVGCAAGLRGVLAEGSALTLTAVPPVLGALLALRVRGPQLPAAEPAFLEVRALSVRRGPAPLRKVALRVAAGECVALFGPGSRTLLAALAGHAPARGKALLGGADLTAFPAGQRTGLGLCHLVGPDPRIPDEQTIAEGLAGHARSLGHADPGAAVRGVLEVFPALRGHGDEPAGKLTGPERGLLALAEALLTRPRLLLVDGLVAGPYADAARTVLRRLAATGTAVVLCEPEVPAALTVADRAYVLGRGRVVAELARPEPDEVHRLLPGAHSAGGPAR